MSLPPLIIRWVRREDAADLQATGFSRNSLSEVQQQIEGSLTGAAREKFLQQVGPKEMEALSAVRNADESRTTCRSPL